MQAFLGGVESMPRTQVVKAIWDYIKANSLQVGHGRMTQHWGFCNAHTVCTPHSSNHLCASSKAVCSACG
jgi:chromatin remodeling complex protein RSC6